MHGLDPLKAGSAYEVWLIDQVPGVHNTVAIDLGDHGDRILNLGALPANGRLVTSVKATTLATRAVDMAAVMRVSLDQDPEYVIGGMQSIRIQIGRQAHVNRRRSAGPIVAAGFNPMIQPTGAFAGSREFPSRRIIARERFGPLPAASLALGGAQGGGSKKALAALIAQGRDLFFTGTFAGNGRTCGTCHQANRNLSIDSAFIATLSPGTGPIGGSCASSRCRTGEWCRYVHRTVDTWIATPGGRCGVC
ncbi:MAG: hypothetical protein ACT4QD_19385, partial [Acidobacteriota bacterium]